MEQELNHPIFEITFRDGATRKCYPKPQTAFDMSRKRSRIAEDEKFFVENAYFLLANADRIMSDSRMFLADTRVYNGTAVSGPFKPACLGAYLEWWIFDRNISLDQNGNPIWLISGSGLSSGHNSQVVTSEGEPKPLVRQSDKITFHDVFKSFLKATAPYHEAMQSCEAYTLKEVVDILKGEQESKGVEVAVHRLAIERLENVIDSKSELIRQKDLEIERMKGTIQLLMFQKHRAKIDDYFAEIDRLEEVVKQRKDVLDEIEYEKFRLRHGQEPLNTNEMDEIWLKLRPARVAYRGAQSQLSNYQRCGLKELIGEDAQWFTYFSAKNMMEQNPTNDWTFDPGYDPDMYD